MQKPKGRVVKKQNHKYSLKFLTPIELFHVSIYHFYLTVCQPLSISTKALTFPLHTYHFTIKSPYLSLTHALTHSFLSLSLSLSLCLSGYPQRWTTVAPPFLGKYQPISSNVFRKQSHKRPTKHHINLSSFLGLIKQSRKRSKSKKEDWAPSHIAIYVCWYYIFYLLFFFSFPLINSIISSSLTITWNQESIHN